jgi:hypothetical protein
MSPSSPATAPQLAETAAALAQWRSTRPRSTRIPEELWSQATELAERNGLAKVAVALKLDYKSLKRRLTAKHNADDARSAPVSSSFVELNLGLPLAPAVCVLVLTDRAGRALRIELPQATGSEVAEVARRLWQVQACSR